MTDADAEMIAVREEIARVLEIVARDGLPEPRDLDVAIDAIDAVYQARLLALAKEAQAARAEAERLREALQGMVKAFRMYVGHEAEPAQDEIDAFRAARAALAQEQK